MADAGHNLSDVLGLLVAWGGAVLARRAPTKRFTYGFKGSTILAALFNALLLLVAIGAVTLEAIQRLGAPEVANGQVVMIVAAIGIAVNGLTAWLFAQGNRNDLNIQAVYLHMLADAAVSAGVVASVALTLWTGLAWIDPLTSLIVIALIFWSTWGLLRQSVGMSLAGVPAGIDLGDVEAALSAAPGVAHVHDLHVWAMSTTEIALTAHLRIPSGHPGDGFLSDLRETCAHRFGIRHMTVQIESGAAADCGHDPAKCA
jgi:cobalt-zinc-cadmium efflux system protein